MRLQGIGKILMAGFALLVTFALLPASATGEPGKGAGPPFREGEIVVAGAPGPQLEGLEVAKYLPHANITVLRVAKGKELATVQRFISHGRKVGLNHLAHAMYVPNDPFYQYQWNFSAVQSEDAWDLSTGAGVTVAVIDSGIATGGNDGISCIVSPRDILNGDDDPEDGLGHGTAVSGIIAQATGNGTGVAGLANGACIMPVKVLNDSGTGAFADIAEGVYYAVDSGADVINISIGTDAYFHMHNDPFMDAALDYALQHNVTVLCAAGNDGYSANVSYPAIYPTTIGVGATDSDNAVPWYSNKGDGLDIVAPGESIYQEGIFDGFWGYYYFSGTSMASPHVAAIVAMLLEVDPTLTPDTIYQILTTTALDLYTTGYDSTSGHGLIQAYNSLNLTSSGNDGDGDGMEDSWELSHGLDPNDPADAAYDNDGDWLTNLDEFHAGTDPLNADTDNDGVDDGFDGYPLDDQQSACFDPLRNGVTLEIFASVQGAVSDPGASDYDTIQISAADFGEDVVYDQNTVLILAGGYYCNFSDNPLVSAIHSLTIQDGTIIVEKLVIH